MRSQPDTMYCRAVLGLLAASIALAACGGNDAANPTQEPAVQVVQHPGSENEPVTLRVNSDLRPPFESHEGYVFIIGGIGDGVGVGQSLDLARVHNPELPTDHEIHTIVPMGGWLAVGGTFYHYIRSEYKGLTFTMSFGSKVTVPMHDANSFLVGAGHSVLVRGRDEVLTVDEVQSANILASRSPVVERKSYSTGNLIEMSDGTRWKILAIEPAKDGLPAYAEIVRLPEDQAAGAKLRNLPLR